MSLAGPLDASLSDDFTSALSVWAASASDLDHWELALTLLDADAATGTQDASASIERARLLLLLGRASEAVSVLAAAQITDVTGDGTLLWRHLVLAACRAGAGDQGSYKWLLWAASGLSGRDSWRVTYLIAAAADGAGDAETGRTAWRRLAADHGRITERTVVEYVAGEVLDRDQGEVNAAVRQIARACAVLEQEFAPLAENFGVVIAAAENLRRRGDAAGARLLVHAATRRNAAAVMLADAARTLAPASMRRYRILATASVLLALALIPVQGVGLLAVVGGYFAWKRFVRLPGLSLVDTRVWRAFNKVRFDRHLGRVVRRRQQPLGPIVVLGAGVGLISGIFIAVWCSGRLHRLFSHGGTASELLQSALILVAFVGPLLLAIYGASVVDARIAAQRVARRDAQADRDASSAACSCWHVSHLLGRSGDRVRVHHLSPVSSLQELAVLRAAFSDSPTLSRCPQTGALWLGGVLAAGALRILLRGPLLDPQTTAQAAESTVGFYL